MRVLVQRCDRACVKVDNKIVGQIGMGVMILVGITHDDDSKKIDYLVDKLLDVSGSILSISQFTLYADTRKGRRPSYVEAMSGDKAKALYDEFNEKLRNTGVKVETGIFGADMKVDFINDGPITIMLEK